MAIRLDIGCGYRKKQGFVNIDMNKNCNPDILLDISKKKLPHKDNTVDEIYCDNVLEHLNEQQIEFVLSEFHRVIKKQGKITIRVPYKTSTGAYYWRHKIFFGYYGLRDFDIEQGKSIQIRHLPKFKFKRRLEFRKGGFIWDYFFEVIFNLPKLCFFYDTTGLCYIFPAQCVIFELKKV